MDGLADETLAECGRSQIPWKVALCSGWIFTLLEVVGIFAMLLILGAYAGSSSGHLNTRSALYQALNLVGSLMFVVYLSVKHAWPSVVLNAVWAAIALFVLLRRAWFPAPEKREQSR